jgi:hypothetical protein
MGAVYGSVCGLKLDWASMETVELESWHGFAGAIQDLRGRYAPTRLPGGKSRLLGKPSDILFRGQADASWPIATTLERRASERISFTQYLEIVSRTIHEIESVTGKRWNLPAWPRMVELLRSDSEPSIVTPPGYDYLVYLRHHGFPSPLLDWTESPYVAAYFAYIERTSKERAVYAYIEQTEGGKGRTEGCPRIELQGPFVSTDVRHFAQKAWYTLAVIWNGDRQGFYFCNHDEVFCESDGTQDVVVKIVLPDEDRNVALRDLDTYNINHYTLFQSEDALVKALESRCFDL